ncbi:MAG: WYL domain-containing protein [Clostridium sp.]|nr:WYL domain-containing protein [Clostridium sp.]
MSIDRKTIKRNLMELIDFGYDIEYSETIRMVKDSKTGELEESSIMSDFYLVRDITDAELRLLIDGLLFSRHIPYSQCRELVEKLEKMSNKYFQPRMSHIHTMPTDKTDNKQLFYNIDVLDEAIAKNRKVSFKYLEYGTDKKQHIKCREDGSERVYVVSPYQMAAREGKYYLICNYDKYDDVSNYRLDRITDIQLLEEKAKPFKDLEWSEGKRLDLKQYMNQHIYMYASPDVTVKFRIVKPMISDIVDMLGTDVRFYNETTDSVCVSASINEQAMLQFAKNYAPDIEILEPVELRVKIKTEIAKGLKVYE